jgi:hypothetical protein
MITDILFHLCKERIACGWILYASNLLDIRSKFDTVSLFVIVQLPKMLYLQGKCQGTPCKDGARPALFLMSELCCPMYCSVSIVLFYVSFVCKCVLLTPGVNPIAVKYIISYHTSYHINHIISYHIISYHIISYHINICSHITTHRRILIAYFNNCNFSKHE